MIVSMSGCAVPCCRRGDLVFPQLHTAAPERPLVRHLHPLIHLTHTHIHMQNTGYLHPHTHPHTHTHAYTCTCTYFSGFGLMVNPTTHAHAHTHTCTCTCTSHTCMRVYNINVHTDMNTAAQTYIYNNRGRIIKQIPGSTYASPILACPVSALYPSG